MMTALRYGVTLCLAAVSLTACNEGGDEAQISEGRARMAEFRDAVDAARAALAAEDMQGVAAQEGRVRAALESARAAFEAADLSGDAAARAEYAEALLRLGDYDLAAKEFEILLEEQPADAVLWMKLGTSLSRLGEKHWPMAQQALEKALALSPDASIGLESQRDLADLYVRMGLYPLAEQTYAAVLESAPEDRRAQLGMALIETRRGNLTEAEAVLEAAGTDAPRFMPDFHQRLRQALQDFEQARMNFQDTAEAHLAYAKLLLQAGRVPESRPALERSLALDEGEYTAWNMLGSVAQQTGDVERAREAFTRSLALNPDQQRTRQALDALGDPAR